MRASYGKTATDFGVDIFFSGHDHMYTRSNRIIIGENTIYADMDFTDKPDGTIFSIASAVGPKFYDINPGADVEANVRRAYPTITLTQAEQRPGVFINVKVTVEKLTVTAMNVDGTQIDQYEVPAKRQ
jgi:hypothetical protein